MLVIVEDGGGLANRLFVFSNVIATGLETGHRVANPAFRRWADSFEGTQGDHLAVFPRRRLAALGGPVASRVAASLSFRISRSLRAFPGARLARAVELHWPAHYNLDSDDARAALCCRFVFLKGWLFRNPSAVERHAAVLREFFRPVASVRGEADRIVYEARAHGEVLVGVHVRHRDYREFEGGRYFYPFPEYIALMSSVAASMAPRKVCFLVCSDEAQDPSTAADLEVTFSRMGPVQDLWALSRCDLIMGPPSTFSSWAAFLGAKPLWALETSHAVPDPQNWQVPLPVPDPPLRASL